MAKEKKEKPPKKPKKPKKPRKPLFGKKKEKQLNKEERAALEALEQGLDGGGEPPKKKKLNPIVLIIAAVVLLAVIAVVVIFVILPMVRGDGEEPAEDEPIIYELPETYTVGEEIITAIVPLERGGVQATQSVRVSYTYTGMTNAGEEVSNYVSELVSEQGFYVVNDEFVRSDAPDFTASEGRVLLAQNMVLPVEEEPEESSQPEESGEPEEGSDGESTPPESEEPSPSPSEEQEEEPEGMVLTVEMTWTEDTCVITGDQAIGRVTNPPREETSAATPGASMSMTEAVDHLYTLNPSVLELRGTSMEVYRIYALDGAVMVDGRPCMRLNVYSREGPEGTNEVAGIYLMSRDGAHLYKLDEAAGTVRELPEFANIPISTPSTDNTENTSQDEAQTDAPEDGQGETQSDSE